MNEPMRERCFCGGTLAQTTIIVNWSIRYSFTVPGWRCGACGEEEIEAPHARKLLADIRKAKAK